MNFIRAPLPRPMPQPLRSYIVQSTDVAMILSPDNIPSSVGYLYVVAGQTQGDRPPSPRLSISPLSSHTHPKPSPPPPLFASVPVYPHPTDMFTRMPRSPRSWCATFLLFTTCECASSWQPPDRRQIRCPRRGRHSLTVLPPPFFAPLTIPPASALCRNRYAIYNPALTSLVVSHLPALTQL